MTTYILKRKTFGIPTFGLKNLANSFGLTNAGKAMSGWQKFKQGAIGAGKLGLTGAAVGGTVLAGKTIADTKDSFDGDGIHG